MFKRKKYEFLPLEATTKKGKKKLKLAEKLEKGGKLKEAANLYREISMFAEAKELYKRAGAYSELAKLFEDEGDIISAANYYLKGGENLKAAQLYERAGKVIQAAKIYQETGVLDGAAALYEEGGDYEKAGEIYFAVGNFKKAIENYEKVENPSLLAKAIKNHIGIVIRGDFTEEEHEELKVIAQKGAELFEKEGKYTDARKLYAFAGDYISTGRMYEKEGDIKRAVDMYLKGGGKGKAAELLSKLNRVKESEKLRGELFLEKGQLLEAVKAFEKAEEFHRAGVIWEKLGKLENAAEMYFRSGEYLRAGELFAKIKKYNRAGESFERARIIDKAIEFYKKGGEEKKVIYLLEKQNRFYDVGDIYLNKGLNDKAIKAFQKVQQNDPHFKDATYYLARIFEEKGRYNLALEKYNELKNFQSESNEFYAEVYYRMGDMEEKLNNLEKAREYFDKVNVYIFDYKDVTMRLQQLQEKIRASSQKQDYDVDVSANTVVLSKKERYKIIEEIGKGGMGIVYKAEDSLLKRIVALKKLPPQFQRDEKAIARFMKEAQSAAILNHPNIVTLYDLGYEPDGSIYIAMEFVEGKTLKEILKESGPFPVKVIILVLGQMAKGLGYAHKKGIVHRDIKPSNIMWTPDKKVKIMDFGLAAAMEELKEGVTTIVGTPYYMSPEQALGNPVDQRTDIYSLGITIYEILVGFPPFKEGDIGYHHIHTPPPPPSKFNRDTPPQLEKIVLKCLEKEPENRYFSTEELLEDLKDLIKIN